MVDNNRWGNFLAHFILILGVAIVVFPVYVAFRGVDPSGRDLRARGHAAAAGRQNAWEKLHDRHFGRTLARRNPAHRRHAVEFLHHGDGESPSASCRSRSSRPSRSSISAFPSACSSSGSSS